MLVDHFLNKLAGKYGRNDLQISKEAYRDIAKHSWPGNIRELQHCIERAIIMCEGPVIEPEDLGLFKTADITHFEQLNLDELEKWAIKTAIRKHKGNISHASKELGLSRGAMYRRMEKYDL